MERCQLGSTLDPKGFEDAAKSSDWCKVMDEQMATLKCNQTSELMDLPLNKEAIGLMWLYKTKFKPDGFVQKLKGMHRSERLSATQRY